MNADEYPIDLAEPDWEEVLRRSAALTRRRGRRTVIAAAVTAAFAVLAGSALAASGWLDSVVFGSPVSSSALSPRDVQALSWLETRAELPLDQLQLPAARLAALEAADLVGVQLIGQTGGSSFYRLEFSNKDCYAVGVTGGANLFGPSVCPLPGKAIPFPSPARPIFDLSLIGADRGQPIHVIDLRGIAATGVASVGVLGSDGTVYGRTEVTDNVYVSNDLPPEADGPIVAYDANGTAIWCSQTIWAQSAAISAACPS